jgi:CPA2 family monovalent cation:H+ antiporter-2
MVGMEHGPSPLFDVLVLLSAAVLAVPVSRALKIGSVLGYLVAGVAIGPHALELITEIEETARLGEFGVVFLLFAIGLELKLSRLAALRRLVFGLGSAQVVVTAAVLAALVLAFSEVAPPVAIVVGAGLALSSTSVVLQILMDRGELTDRAGRVAFAVLLLQDLAVVPLLLLVDAIGGGGGRSGPELMGMALLKAVGVGLLIIAVGRLLVRPFLRIMAASRSPELFAAAALLVVLGTAWATEQAGLSMVLGAFMAGVLLAETEFRHQVEADIQPYRGVLLGLFFMTVGMNLDLGLLWRDLATVLTLLAALILIKAMLLFTVAMAFRLGADIAVHISLLLAQGGEFAFVLFGQATANGVLPPDIAQVLTLAVTASMMVTPGLAALAVPLAARLHGNRAGLGRLDEIQGIADHVIVAGFGRVGRTVSGLLADSNVPYLALDLASDRVLAARAEGLPVYFADASRHEVLNAAGAARARVLVLTLDRAGTAERTVAALRQHFPELPIYARARDHDHGDQLLRQGATMAVPETVEASLQLGATVLRALGTPRDSVEQLLESNRRRFSAGRKRGKG